MFKFVMLEKWHTLSDVELETALRVGLDFIQLCGFGVIRDIPDTTMIQD